MHLGHALCHILYHICVHVLEFLVFGVIHIGRDWVGSMSIHLYVLLHYCADGCLINLIHFVSEANR